MNLTLRFNVPLAILYLREKAHFLIWKQFVSFVLQDDICCLLQPLFIFKHP